MRSAKRTVTSRRSDVTGWETSNSASEFPHWPQNLVPGSLAAEQDGQVTLSGFPQLPQNLLPVGLEKSQKPQITSAQSTYE